MAHGWSATKEFDLDEFAAVFQANGMHAMAYDHRFAKTSCIVGKPGRRLMMLTSTAEASEIPTLDRTHLDRRLYLLSSYQIGPTL